MDFSEVVFYANRAQSPQTPNKYNKTFATSTMTKSNPTANDGFDYPTIGFENSTNYTMSSFAIRSPSKPALE